MALLSCSFVTATDQPEKTVAPSTQWEWAFLGRHVGDVLQALDLDSDGEKELVVTSRENSFGPVSLFVYEHDLINVRCVFDAESTIYDLEAIEFDMSTGPELLLATSVGLVLLNSQTCEVIHRVDVLMNGAGLGDVDEDGVVEVAYRKPPEDQLRVAPWNDIDNEVVRLGFGGNEIRFVNIDDVPGEDLLIQSGSTFYLLNGNSLETIFQWTAKSIYADAFVAQAVPGGLPELYLGDDLPLKLQVISLESGAILEEIALEERGKLVATSDLDGDELFEWVLSRGQSERVEAIATDGTVLASIESGFTLWNAIAPFHFDDDGELDLLAAKNFPEAGLTWIHPATEEVVWDQIYRSGPFYMAQPNDYLDNGSIDVALSFHRSSYDNRRDPAA